MCLAIPGRITGFVPETFDQLALADVLGVEQKVNVGMLEDVNLQVGDYVLIHMGFATSRIERAEAQEALSMLEMLGDSPDEEQAAAGWGNR